MLENKSRNVPTSFGFHKPWQADSLSSYPRSRRCHVTTWLPDLPVSAAAGVPDVQRTREREGWSPRGGGGWCCVLVTERWTVIRRENALRYTNNIFLNPNYIHVIWLLITFSWIILYFFEKFYTVFAFKEENHRKCAVLFSYLKY